MKPTQQVLEAGLRLVDTGLSDGTSGNVSVRCPEGSDILITPSARDFRLLTERDLARVDLETGEARGPRKPSSEWRLHVAIYRARSDANAIIHHHGSWVSAVAVARKCIPVLIDEAADIGLIPTAPYAPSATEELAVNAAREFANGSNAVLLANHGAVVVGRHLSEALRRALESERLSMIFVGAQSLGGALALDEAQVAVSRKFFEDYRDPEKYRALAPASRGIAGPVRFEDLVNYGFRAGMTFASLVQNMILQRLHKVRS